VRAAVQVYVDLGHLPERAAEAADQLRDHRKLWDATDRARRAAEFTIANSTEQDDAAADAHGFVDDLLRVTRDRGLLWPAGPCRAVPGRVTRPDRRLRRGRSSRVAA
jgi:hypothetical protein